MGAGNISTVIGPALLWPTDKDSGDAAKQLEAINVANRVTLCMIEGYAGLTPLMEERAKEKKRLKEEAEQEVSVILIRSLLGI